MKNSIKYLLLLITAAFIACKEEPKKPKVSYEKASSVKEQAVVDTSQVEIADLPIQMEGTNYLIHPIASLNLYGGSSKSKYDSSSSVSRLGYANDTLRNSMSPLRERILLPFGLISISDSISRSEKNFLISTI